MPRSDVITFGDADLARRLITHRQGDESIGQTAKRLLNAYVQILDDPVEPTGNGQAISEALTEGLDNLQDALVQITRARRLASVVSVTPPATRSRKHA